MYKRMGEEGREKKRFLTGTVRPLGDNVVSHVLWSVPRAMVSDCVINRTRNGARVAARDTRPTRFRFAEI